MSELSPDPLADGIEDFGQRLRQGAVSAEAATAAYLARIEALPRLGAFEHVAADRALACARALDRLLAAGTDLGPLMGVPVAIKDIVAVDGMPVTAGSALDVAALIGPEGGFVKALRHAGCVILGKTRTVEFALGGADGVNTVRGTPWNPWDSHVQRGPGGSSSGSAVAVAAGLCGFAIGSDTGGSVRLPAALCGIFGLKPTTGTWPTDGVFPLCQTLDTLGLLTRSAADAARVHATLTHRPPPAPARLARLVLGRPVNQFVDPPDAEVETAFAAALAALQEAGARIVDVEVPELGPPEAFFHAIVPAGFLAAFGRERFLAERQHLGPDIAARGEAGLAITADAYLGWQRRRQELCRRAHEAIQGFDGWITPTLGLVAPPVADFAEVTRAFAINARIGHYTRPVNLFGFCATSTPIPGGTLPMALQVMAPAGADGALLATAMAIEALLGAPRAPDLTGFLGGGAIP
jgi:aspartyl-tRNA(Asn)/glutamyl-tRNA(Gln) amidotransferase subunit A